MNVEHNEYFLFIPDVENWLKNIVVKKWNFTSICFWNSLISSWCSTFIFIIIINNIIIIHYQLFLLLLINAILTETCLKNVGIGTKQINNK